MKLIFGLGNPGKKYERTRHNVGFMVLDEFAKKNKLKFKFDPMFNAELTTIHHQGEKITLVKPSTYMNLSGQAVLRLCQYFNVDLNDILIFVDDVHLENGQIRLRELGGHGGHNGLRNIIGILKSEQFKRVRIGVGNDHSIHLDQHVLGKFTKDEKIDIDIAVIKAVEIIELFIEGKPYLDIMTKFNTQT